MKRSLAVGAVLMSILASLTPARSAAAPGDLDPTFGGFGTGGKIQDVGFEVRAMVIDAQGRLVLAGSKHNTFHVQRRSGPTFATIEDAADIIIQIGQTGAHAYAVATAPDGKIVVAGELDVSTGPSDFAVARLNPDLTLDRTFAGGGATSSDFHGNTDAALAVAVQSDRKILVFGDAEKADLAGESAGERLNEDGTFDANFNGNGRVTFDNPHEVSAVAVQGDKILVAGSNFFTVPVSNAHFGIARLNLDGSTDSSFGDSGLVDVDFGLKLQSVNAIALAPDGKIVVTGDVSDSIGVVRLLDNGTLDPSFHGNGQLLASIDGNAAASSVLVQPDGKIVVAGQNVVTGQPNRFILLRYNSDGSPDATFGAGGTALTSFSGDSGVRALALQPDGMLIAAGGTHAARYRSDGSLDAGGTMDLIFDPAHRSSEVTALAVAPGGKLVAAGKVLRSDYDMALARFAADYGDGLDLGFGNGPLFATKTGRTLYGLTGENEEIRAMAVQSDGAIVVGGQLLLKNGQNEDLMMGRFTSDGMPVELGFFPPRALCNGVGFNSVDFGFGDDPANAIAVTDDGKTYAAGTVRGPTGNDFGLVRFLSDCSVDTTGVIAGNQFKVRFDLGGDDAVGGMVLQNGKPVLGGTSNGAITLIRVRMDTFGRPQLDAGFGTSGHATLAAGTLPAGTMAVITGLATQSDGKLIVSGSATFPNGQTHFVVARFSAEGQLDASFGVRSPGFNMMDTANALAVRSDDTIAVAGSTQTSAGTVFALAQFTADGRIDTGFNGTGQVTLQLGPDGEDVAQAVTFVGTNHVVVGGYSLAFGIRQFALAAFETTPAQPAVACPGDCNDDAAVTVDELLTLVNIALGTADVSTCTAGDADQDGQVTIDEILAAVNAALTGCPKT